MSVRGDFIEIWHGPANSELDDELLNFYEGQIVDSGESSLVVVTPTARKKRAVQREIGGRLGKSLVGLPVLRLEEFVDELFETLKIAALDFDDHVRRVILEEVLSGLEPENYFYRNESENLVDPFRKFFGDLKDYDYTPERLEERLEEDGLSGEKYRDLLDIYDQFEEARRGSLREAIGFDAELVSTPDKIHKLIGGDGLESFEETFPRVEYVVFEGFYTFRPPHKKLIESLADRTEVIVGLYLEDYPSKAFELPGEVVEWFENRPELEVEEREFGNPRNDSIYPVTRNLFVSRRDRKSDQTGEDPGLSFFREDSRLEEVRTIASKIKQMFREGKIERMGDVAVVFPDSAKYEGLIRTVFPQYDLPYDFARGFPLANSPVAKAIQSIVGLVKANYRREDVTGFLMSDYVTAPRELDAVFLDTQARKAGIEGGNEDLRIEEWVGKLEERAEFLKSRSKEMEVGGRHYTEMDRKIDERNARKIEEQLPILKEKVLEPVEGLRLSRDMQEFLDELEELVKRFEIPRNSTSDDMDGELCERNESSLQEFASMFKELRVAESLRSGERDFSRCVEVFRSACSRRKIRSKSPERERVQILDPLEIQGIHFPQVFFGGLLDEDFPRKPRRSWIIPEESDAVELIERKGEARYLLYHVLRGTTRSLTLSCPTKPKQEDRRVASPFLKHVEDLSGPGLELERPEPHSVADLQEWMGDRLGEPTEEEETLKAGTYLAQTERRSVKNSSRNYLVERGRQLETSLSEYEGVISDEDILENLEGKYTEEEYVHSSSRIDDYAKCPFKFYMDRVLGLEELEEVDVEISPMDKGSVIHEILSDFFEWRRDEFETAALRGDMEEKEIRRLEDKIQRIAEEEIGKYHYEGVFWESFVSDVISGFDGEPPGLLKRFLRHEMEEVEDEYEPTHFEVRPGEFSDSDTVVLDLDGAEFRTTGYIDRVDVRGSDGGEVHRIIDYKTGSVTPKAIKEGLSFQMPIYMLSWSAVQGLDFDQVNARYYLVPARGGVGLKPAWNDISEGWRNFPGRGHLVELLSEIVERMKEGKYNLPFFDKRLPCRYCKFTNVCRHDPSHMRLVRMSLGEEAEEYYVPEVED